MNANGIIKKKFIACVFLALAVVVLAKEIKMSGQTFVGVFSNMKSSNDELRLVLNDDGKGAIFGMAFVPLLWKLGPTNNQITLTYSTRNDHETNLLVIIFDPEKSEIKFLPNKFSFTETLHLTTNQPPKRLHNILLHFDGTENSLVHGCTDTIGALSMTNHVEDLRKLEHAIQEEGLYCRFNTGIAGEQMNLLAVDVRDVALVRTYATNQIIQSLLSVKIRKSGEKNIFEVWEGGKKTREEHYNNNGPVPTWVRP